MFKWIVVAIGAVTIIVTNKFMWEVMGVGAIILALWIGSVSERNKKRKLRKYG